MSGKILESIRSKAMDIISFIVSFIGCQITFWLGYIIGRKEEY